LPPGTPPQNLAPAVAPKAQVSLPHLYWHFLLYQNHLDRVAATREQQGKNGKWLRDHFQKRLAFTDTQFAAVRAAAQRLEAQLKDIRAKAMPIIQADRQLAGLGMPTGSPPVPTGGVRDPNRARPGRAQLQELQLQHEAAITNEMNRLKQDLGPEASAKLENFLQNDLARHVTSIHFQPPANVPFRTPNHPVVQGVHP
jgi:hypothetical protein